MSQSKMNYGHCPVFPDPTTTTTDTCTATTDTCTAADTTTTDCCCCNDPFCPDSTIDCDADCCNLCCSLDIGDAVTLGTVNGSVIIGTVATKNFIHGCRTVTITATDVAVNGTPISFPADSDTVPVTICCKDINLVVKTTLSLSE